MSAWFIVFLIFSWFLSIASFLPAFNIQHWSFRIFDFIRVQHLVVLVVFFGLSWFGYSVQFWATLSTQIALVISLMFQAFIIAPYLSFFRSKKTSPSNLGDVVSIINSNVLQSNTEYQKLIDLVNEYQPDILFTLETNTVWEQALSQVENHYKNVKKVPKENRYGMHFYTKLGVDDIKVHYFISDERPAIEAHLRDHNNRPFILWGVHPPPPSPTEKETSKQKDAELMYVAKAIRKQDKPCVVIGDFNNVAWSRSSKLFARISNLNDARIGRGIYGTFPVRPWFLRFPIDLLFFSKGVSVENIKTLPNIDSDHLPLFSSFRISADDFDFQKSLHEADAQKAKELIAEGHEAEVEEE